MKRLQNEAITLHTTKNDIEKYLINFENCHSLIVERKIAMEKNALQ